MKRSVRWRRIRMTDSSTASASRRLRRVLGVGFGLAVIVGSTLGVGILRTPGMVAGALHTPSTTLIVWLAGGLYTLLGSICLTELGTMAPQAGGTTSMPGGRSATSSASRSAGRTG